MGRAFQVEEEQTDDNQNTDLRGCLLGLKVQFSGRVAGWLAGWHEAPSLSPSLEVGKGV